MGLFTAGSGTVFNAGTVNWGAALADPVVARITANVIDRLTVGQQCPGWDVVGTRERIRALAGTGSLLFAVLDLTGELAWREACGQNLRWQPIQEAGDVVALGCPRDAVAGGPRGLYAVRADGKILLRPITTSRADWREAGMCPPGPRALAFAKDHLYVLDASGNVWDAPQGAIPTSAGEWTAFVTDSSLVALAGGSGRLFGVTAAGALAGWLPVAGQPWGELGHAGGCTLIAAHAGAIYGISAGSPLRRYVPALAKR